MVRLVLLGPAGAGKGTQSRLIAEKYNIPAISTGDIFRNNIKEGTALGLRAQEYMSKGELVPDNLVIGIVFQRLEEEDCQNGFLLDGFPRTTYQAEQLDIHLAQKGLKLNKVLDLQVDKEILVDRIAGRRVCTSCGKSYHVTNHPPKQEGVCDVCGGEVIQRSDDNIETVTKRTEVYFELTRPLTEYYRERGILAEINGQEDLPIVFDSIVKAVGDVE